MARRSLPRKVTYFEPAPPRFARNTIIESTFDCGQLDPGAVIRRAPGEWHPRMPEWLDEAELAGWLSGRNAVYQLAALTIGARVAVAMRRGHQFSSTRGVSDSFLQKQIVINCGFPD